MIKLLKSKLLLSFIVLVAMFFVTSSLYAYSNPINNLSISGSITSEGIPLYDYSNFKPNSYPDGDYDFKVLYFKSGETYYCCLFYQDYHKFEDNNVVGSLYTPFFILDNANMRLFANNVIDSQNYESDMWYLIYDSEAGIWGPSLFESSGITCDSNEAVIYSDSNIDVYLGDCSNTTKWYQGRIPIYYEAEEHYVDSSPVDYNFDYKIEGVSYDKCLITISNLHDSLHFIGYVNNPNEYNVGDILERGTDLKYQVITPPGISGPNYSGYLKPGDNLVYYIIDDSFSVVAKGTIDEMSSGYFLYAYSDDWYAGDSDWDLHYRGIKFAFLKDGKHYWSDDLDFVYIDPNGYYHNNDQIITLDTYYIKVFDDIYSYTVTGQVLDKNGEIIQSVDFTLLQDLSFLELNYTSIYFDDESLLGTITSQFILNGFYLVGQNSSGEKIDFTGYSLICNIDKKVLANTTKYEVNDEEAPIKLYAKSTISNKDSIFFPLDIHLELEYKDYKPFNFTFEVYDSKGNLALTKIVSSDEIITNQIKFDEQTSIDDKEYAVEGEPNFNSNGLSSGDLSNPNSNFSSSDISSWDINDYLQLFSTDNFVWKFIISFLDSLPAWITTPLYLLLFGIVIITLYRFIRGA